MLLFRLVYFKLIYFGGIMSLKLVLNDEKLSLGVGSVPREQLVCVRKPQGSYRMAWIGRDLQDHVVPTFLTEVGMPHAKPG